MVELKHSLGGSSVWILLSFSTKRSGESFCWVNTRTCRSWKLRHLAVRKSLDLRFLLPSHFLARICDSQELWLYALSHARKKDSLILSHDLLTVKKRTLRVVTSQPLNQELVNSRFSPVPCPVTCNTRRLPYKRSLSRQESRGCQGYISLSLWRS